MMPFMAALWHLLFHTDAGLLMRIAIGAAIFFLLALSDLRRNGPRATRWKEYCFLLAVVAAAMVYGAANDLITSAISWEYFFYGKDLAHALGDRVPPDPLALAWEAAKVGMKATWTVGLLIGVALLVANNPASLPDRLEISDSGDLSKADENKRRDEAAPSAPSLESGDKGQTSGTPAPGNPAAGDSATDASATGESATGDAATGDAARGGLSASSASSSASDSPAAGELSPPAEAPEKYPSESLADVPAPGDLAEAAISEPSDETTPLHVEVRPAPQLSYSTLLWILPFIFTCCVVYAIPLGLAGYFGLFRFFSADFREMIRQGEFRPARYMAVYGIHLGGYLGGIVGTFLAVIWIRIRRVRDVADGETDE
jgi:hypothetical protein